MVKMQRTTLGYNISHKQKAIKEIVESLMFAVAIRRYGIKMMQIGC